MVVTMIDGTRIEAKFGDCLGVVCEVRLTDGARIRTRTDPGIDFCAGSGSSTTTNGVHDDDKYLVCRRDMSGYEFVNDLGSVDRWLVAVDRDLDRSSDELPIPDTPVLRTLTRARFDQRTACQLDEVLSRHLRVLGTLADRLNAEFSDDENIALEPEE